MKTMPRILLLLFSLSVMTMIFIARCGLYMDGYLSRTPNGLPTVSDKVDVKRQVRDVLQEKESQHSKVVQSLQKQIDNLENRLREAQVTEVEIQTYHIMPKNLSDFSQFFNEQLQAAEILQGMPLKTEYDVVSFNRFTLNRVYLVDPGLGKRVIEKPIGYKKKDLLEIITHAMNKLNENRTGPYIKLYTMEDFLEGLYRIEPTTGTHYELYFQDIDSSVAYSYKKVILMRPFGPPMLVSKNKVTTDQAWINLILPLSGRIETFRLFMERFVSVCIKQDKRVYLTVVYFGTDGLQEVKNIMSAIAKHNKFKHMKLVTLNEKFARGRGLQIGALNWKSGDAMLFLCDVDIVFNGEFLERCRLNTERGRRVYYPIVFSLYNPNVVYSLQDITIPNLKDQLVISKDTGFWRDFGYGMTCQYRSDFLKIKGFDEHITGWGGEDVFLYQKYVRSDYLVVRATDPGIFHLWHEKYCDPNLTPEQYRSCIRSKALNEASHAQLGLLAFKDEVDIHRSFVKKSHEKY
ncbi:hypothetical protein LOTGIDRAFT_174094 [Lottia gigantea]|uniref:Hexosyltransferase n=1 Tax=Lottia gigantea TaxID=225164 RepID=V4AYB7_LOTGI|nr:hypothetical protein LOTGIDRAFT_174094 [Lottia gigantea]ESO98621.1 hypothetical protein LOTGIDRAFT_174094 [Lottia gigantea]